MQNRWGKRSRKPSAVEVVYVGSARDRKRARACRDVGVDVSEKTRSISDYYGPSIGS
jgi:hypothetical protein